MTPNRPPLKSPYLLLALAVLVLDQWTKHWLEERLPLGAVETVIPGFLNLVHVRNTGAAFGLFATDTGSTSWMLTLLGLLALLAVGIYFRFTPPDDRLLLTSLSLVAGGAVGNLMDRVIAGSVTDFIDVYVNTWHWPSFNVADSAITVGIVLMVIDTFRRREHPEAEADRSSASRERPAGDPEPAG